LIAYSQLHPISPGMERMLAQIAHITSISGGVKVNDERIEFSEFLIRPYPEEN
jgi:hypothetical protein